MKKTEKEVKQESVWELFVIDALEADDGRSIHGANDEYTKEYIKWLEEHVYMHIKETSTKMLNIIKSAKNNIKHHNQEASLIKEAILQLGHCEVFISSREKMHIHGRELHEDLLQRLKHFANNKTEEIKSCEDGECDNPSEECETCGL